MGATTETLLELKAVTDHDTGMYYVGEIDWAEHHTLQKYIELYGRKGAERLHKVLNYWIYEIEKRTRELPDASESCDCAKVKIDPASEITSQTPLKPDYLTQA